LARGKTLTWTAPQVVHGQLPAYLIYTSGSTGQPKGVLGHHQGLVNRSNWQARTFALTATAIVGQKTSIAFVDSLAETCVPLLNGATLAILPPACGQDVEQLCRAIQQHEVSWLVLVPSLLQALLEVPADTLARLASLRICVCSGEALPVSLLSRMRQHLPWVRLLNLYGSTEVCADGTALELSADWPQDRPMQVGKALDNVRIYVLDESLQSLPNGLRGEVYVAGAGLALEYLGRAALTAGSFVPDPFVGGGQRMYRTGDIGRMMGDGSLELLGRNNQQHKINGNRIDLREIEAVLKGFPGVHQASVTVDPRTAALCAHVSPMLPGADLATHLARLLPRAWVPGRLYRHERLPRLPNGKIDKRHLAQLSSELPHSPPAQDLDPVEQTLLQLWNKVLGASVPASPEADFFACGATSLHAILLCRELNVWLQSAYLTGYQVQLAWVFRYPRLADMARELQGEARSAYQGPVTRTLFEPLSAASDKPVMLCLHPLGGQVQGYRPLVRLLPEWQLIAVTSTDLVEPQASLPGLREQADYYGRQWLTRGHAAPRVVLGYSQGALLAFELSKWLGQHAAAPECTVLLDPLYLGSDPGDSAQALQRYLEEHRLGLDLDWQHLEGLSEQERLGHLATALELAGLPPEAVTVELLRPYFRGHERVRNYRPEGQVRRLALLHGESRSEPDPRIEIWREHSVAPLLQAPLMANHVALLWSPQVQETAEQIRVVLNASSCEERGP
ncbi:MAG: AMP-binding protein, partial [Pseudomonas sp.]